MMTFASSADELAFFSLRLQLNGHDSSFENHEPRPPHQSEHTPLSLGSVASVGGVVDGPVVVDFPVSQVHRLIPDTFSVPTKCCVCSTLMLGQQWQGLRCKLCAFNCHIHCRQLAPTSCQTDQTDSESGQQPSFGEHTLIIIFVEEFNTLLSSPVETHSGL